MNAKTSETLKTILSKQVFLVLSIDDTSNVCKFELRCFTVNKIRIEYSQSGAFVLNFFLALNFCFCFDFIEFIFLCFYYNLQRTVVVMEWVEVKHFTLYVVCGCM